MAKKIGLKTKTSMPCADPGERRHTFGEVALGYTLEMARQEADRCIQCKNRPCVAGCPVEIDIPTFVRQVAEKDLQGAFNTLMARNVLPSICGRVCPQEEQCEKLCTLGVKFEPVGIGRLERYVADFASQMNIVDTAERKPSTGHTVAVVGSGPAGLTVAADLAKMGHAVTIFEALHKSGGVLIYGIPEFRLPKAIVQAEVNYLEKLGVKVECNCVVGRIETVDELLQEYDAVFLGLGAGLPQFVGVPGENFCGIYSANEYLTRSNLMKAYLFPQYDTPIARGKNVAVFGAGNVAMDSARTALRLGADSVRIIYRRSRDEMPARIEEVHHAEEEGVQFYLLTAPTRFLGNDNGWVTGVECLRMELGEPDESGRRRPVPIKGSEFQLECDLAVVAIGAGPNPLLPPTPPGVALNR